MNKILLFLKNSAKLYKRRDGGLNPIVPPKSVASSALTLVVAIMSCLACLTIGGVILINDAANNWAADVSSELTIEIAAQEGRDMEALAQQAASLARSIQGVDRARVLSREESAQLLEPWLGMRNVLEELPVPYLVALEAEDLSKDGLDLLRTKLAESVLGATLDDHKLWTDHLISMAKGSVALGLGILMLMLIATILCVVFATRAAMAGNREVVEVLDYVGAGRLFVAREFQKHFLLLGLKGGVFGGLSAMIGFFLLSLFLSSDVAGAKGDQIEALFGTPHMGYGGYLGALGIIGLIALLTAATSRITVFRYLSDSA